jgi:hypothetical protein
MKEVISFLPSVVWYLTSNGRDMWCRSPYGFFFSTAEAASAFARSQAPSLELLPIGVASVELVSSEGARSLRNQAVTRVFIDPQVDAASGDVYGKILRIEEGN